MKKEVKTECDWLKKWGSTFKEAFKGSPMRGDFDLYYKTCIDAYHSLTGADMKFHTEESLIAALADFKNYIITFASGGGFANASIYQSHLKMIDEISQMLTVTQKTQNTEGVQKSLF